MKVLKDILYGVKINQVVGNTDLTINALYLSSLEVKTNGVFIAVKGFSTDGHKYIASAIENGAVAIVCEVLPSEIDENVVYVVVEDSSIALAVLANNFYDNPSSNIQLIGVTGTNGKTSVATLLFKLYTKLGYKVGLLSTVENKIGDNWKLYTDQKTARKFGRVIALETDGSQEIAKGMPIEYQGVKVGEVTLVVPNFRRNMVEITARILPEYVENIAVEGSHFWLTEPEIGLGGVKNLGALVSKSISVEPGKGKAKFDFQLENFSHQNPKYSISFGKVNSAPYSSLK